MNQSSYDTIIIGTDPNGLIAANRLAAAGQRLLVMERLPHIGGTVSDHTLWAGYRAPAQSPDVGLLRQDVLDALGLPQQGLRFIESEALAHILHANGSGLTLWRDLDRSVAAIAQHSPADARAFPQFVAEMQRLNAALEPYLRTTHDVASLGTLFVNEPALVRMGTLPLYESLNQRFESDLLKGSLGAIGVAGMMRGPHAQGTLFHLLRHFPATNSGGYRSSRFVQGGLGQLSATLAQAARQRGVEIRLDTAVQQVALEDGRAIGIVLASGEMISARRIVSSLDARNTFFNLVGAPNLEPSVVRRVRNIKYRGCSAQINLALRALPEFSGVTDQAQISGHILIAPDLNYLERAYDAAKYGDFSPQPLLDIVIPTLLDPALAPPDKHLMTITMQYAPYHLRGKNWDDLRQPLADTVIDTLKRYAPGIDQLILHQQVITPLDYERDFGLSEGNLDQGEMSLEQMFAMRPLPGWSDYCTPIENLWLCGAAAHPGGGVTGLPGWLAAGRILHHQSLEK